MKLKTIHESIGDLPDKDVFDGNEYPPFCTMCGAPEVHPFLDNAILVRGYKVDNYSQCLVCSGCYDAQWNLTKDNHDPEKGWFSD